MCYNVTVKLYNVDGFGGEQKREAQKLKRKCGEKLLLK